MYNIGKLLKRYGLELVLIFATYKLCSIGQMACICSVGILLKLIGHGLDKVGV